MLEAKQYAPAWAVLLAALVFPVLIAFVFLLLFGLINSVVSPAEYHSDPLMGQRLANRDIALFFLVALAQIAFVGIGAWRIAMRPGIRVFFLLIAIPVSAIVFLALLVGSLAR